MSFSFPSLQESSILEITDTTLKKSLGGGTQASLPSIVIAGNGHSLVNVDYRRLIIYIKRYSMYNKSI